MEGNDGEHMMSEWCAIKVMGFIILLAYYLKAMSQGCAERMLQRNGSSR